MRFDFFALALVLGIFFSATQGNAQASAPSILVIDASNSMWGRIDGRAKMEIAREAVSSLVDTLPKSGRLGIVAYGHRRAGDCADIETVLPVGAVDKGKVQAVAGKLTPRGKTPITGALKEAAGLLDAGKPGSVIIVTDGIETCKGDPCALAEELKRKNAAFVAHVIGFDVSAVERPKLACIAERTGGTFLVAANAGELGQALKATAQAKPKAAVLTRAIALEATDAGRPVSGASFVIARSGDIGVYAETSSASISLPPARYRVSAVAGVRTGQVDVDVTRDAPTRIVVPLAGELPKASLQPVKVSVPATGIVEVRWTGPNGKGDYVSLASPNGEPLETRQFSYTEAGNPLKVRVPGESGEYELRYVYDATGTVIARARITVTAVTARLDAPAKAAAGAELPVTFEGPGAAEDWVGLATPGADANTYEGGAWTYAENGSPAKLRLPAEPGIYELRYVSGLDPKILASRKVEVTAAAAALAAPARAMAGSMLQVGFRGTGGGDTFIGIVKKGAPPGAWISFRYPEDKEQVSLHVPGEPGAYEVRFVLEANGVYKVLAASPLAVEPAIATVSAPDRVKAGAQIKVAFTGPKGQGDYIAIAPPGNPANETTQFQSVDADAPGLTVSAPDEPGVYEMRYVMAAPGLDGDKVIARRPLKVD